MESIDFLFVAEISFAKADEIVLAILVILSSSHLAKADGFSMNFLSAINIRFIFEPILTITVSKSKDFFKLSISDGIVVARLFFLYY